MKKKLIKIGYKKEPRLDANRYVVRIGKHVKDVWRWTYHYPRTKKEVVQIAKSAAKGSIVEVFSAAHNFIQAYEVK